MVDLLFNVFSYLQFKQKCHGRLQRDVDHLESAKVLSADLNVLSDQVVSAIIPHVPQLCSPAN